MDKAIIKLAELKKMTGTDRARLLAKLREQMRSNRFEVKSSQSQAVRKIRQIKRSIARIMTVESSLGRQARVKEASSSKATVPAKTNIVQNKTDKSASLAAPKNLSKVSK